MSYYTLEDDGKAVFFLLLFLIIDESGKGKLRVTRAMALQGWSFSIENVGIEVSRHVD